MSASFTLDKILDVVGPSEFEGDRDRVVLGPSSLTEASSDNISFLADAKHVFLAASTKAGCLVISQKLRSETMAYGGAKIFVGNAQEAWAKVLGLWERELLGPPWGIDEKAVVSRTAKLGKNVSIGALTVIEDKVQIADGTVIYPQCYIGRDVAIGADSVIYPQVVIRERCRIGNRVIIQPGAIIGGDGFGFVPANGRHVKVPQIGIVEIEDDVEIGANATIDRAMMGATRIGAGTKLDNLVHVGHNSVLGKHCLMAGQAGLAGSVTLGDGVVMGGQVAIKDHTKIASGTMIGGQAGVIGDIKTKDVLMGTPAMNLRQFMKLQALINKLPEIYDFVKKRSPADTPDGR
ncbi:MAG: UDP-3-O-(3-hydroxymyristoyl)glucosamine N-acyltransferase [Elusimicrobia bacterium]|nr:UDP-3-O-(3-hydroxymyristoyl)glucosamine N-acyltransferase [Elusimicrobiota bacterium]